MPYNTQKQKIGHITYSKDNNKFVIINQTNKNSRINSEYDLLIPSQTAITHIREKSTDWEIMDSHTDPSKPEELFEVNEQYKNWTIEFGGFDTRIIPYIVVEPILRQKYDEPIDEETFDNFYVHTKTWEVEYKEYEKYKVDNIKLHYGVYLGASNDVDTVYEVKLLVEVINPYEFI